MARKGAKSIIRDFVEAFNRKDVETLGSYFVEDATFIRPEGTFKGREEIKRYYRWLFNQYVKITFGEVNLVVVGKKAFLELLSEGDRPDGMKQRLPALMVFEFTGDKVQEVHDYYDRLLIAQQLSKGWLGKMIVNGLVNRMGKGLR